MTPSPNLTDKLASLIQRKFTNDGLDASYMSDEEIARVAAQAVAERLDEEKAKTKRLREVLKGFLVTYESVQEGVDEAFYDLVADKAREALGEKAKA